MIKITSVDGKIIDVSEYVDQMVNNYSLKRNILYQTPIGKTADKKYFWWDEEKNPILKTRSVNQLIKFVRALYHVQKE